MNINTKLNIFCFFLIFVSYNLNGQNSLKKTTYNTDLHQIDENKSYLTISIPSERKNTISGTLGLFDPWIGVSYERLFSARWGVDVSAGLLGGSVGAKFYFPRVSEGKVSLLVGISEGVLLLVGPKHYIPVGMTYLRNNGLRFSIDFGPQIYHDGNEEIQLGISLKLGKSF